MAPRKKNRRRQLTPEQRQERLQAAYDTLSDAVEKLTTADGWQQMITRRAWLRRYSLGNLLMILAQREDATDVRSYNDWRAAGRHVRKGERGIRILAPLRYRERDEDDTPLTNPGGAPRYRVRGFTVVSVFDISQTDGPPLPEDTHGPRLLDGAAPARLWDAIADQITGRGYTIERDTTAPANGWVRFDTRTVRVSDTLPDAHAVKTLIHELAHIWCEHDTRDVPRKVGEIEAESVACLVCSLVGLDSLPYSVPYVAGWAKDADTARTTAERVLTVADAIADALSATVAMPAPDTAPA
ncbi:MULTISPECIES: ArdC-like ssDNA-binding domain-containing protein [Nocardiopsis]|uniref:Antirestriction protein ArdC n=1 Tax=Nocardiopsis metallicus TaxID=179819 RepID=A0A840WBC9_9ACTN|nr:MULTISPECIES: ArdC-like ssDNA-binding domain-containing protein [Nocardiopsis]MBB5493432.1 antirestriction protein ArdC [Nocardiopsis metallicus]MCK9873047.1 ArdC family protein [Nocardiopsis dassonvillei]